MSQGSSSANRKKFTPPPRPSFLNEVPPINEVVATPQSNDATGLSQEPQVSQETMQTSSGTLKPSHAGPVNESPVHQKPEEATKKAGGFSDYMELISGLEKKAMTLGSAFQQKRESLKPKLTLALRGRLHRTAPLISLRFWTHFVRKKVRRLKRTAARSPATAFAAMGICATTIALIFIFSRPSATTPADEKIGSHKNVLPSGSISSATGAPINAPSNPNLSAPVQPINASTSSLGTGQNKIQRNIGSQSLQAPEEIKGTIVHEEVSAVAPPPTSEMNGLINSPVTPPTAGAENIPQPEHHVDPNAVFGAPNDAQRTPAGVPAGEPIPNSYEMPVTTQTVTPN